MRTIVIDSSCLIDMHKGRLLISMLNLPYDFQLPETIFKDELLSIASTEKKSLKKQSLTTLNIPKTWKAFKFRALFKKTVTEPKKQLQSAVSLEKQLQKRFFLKKQLKNATFRIKQL